MSENDPAVVAPPVAPTPDERTQNPPTPVDPAQHDETDVQAALARQTQDGKGGDEVPESDFHSFATDGVEDDGTITLDQIAEQVLAGKWGAGEEKRERLSNSGYDPAEVAKIVNRHLTNGAPTVFPTSVRDDAVAVIRGEWGTEEDEIKGNLDRAGKNSDVVWTERTRQLGL